MVKNITIEEIITKNPRLNLDRLERARKLANRLREAGVRKPEYSLATPAESRRVRAKPLHTGYVARPTDDPSDG